MNEEILKFPLMFHVEQLRESGAEVKGFAFKS